jgi:hypothetical protein
MPHSGKPDPQEPEWRATLRRVSAWRDYVARRMSDEELSRHARAEFTRAGSEVFGFYAYHCTVQTPAGVRTRIVVATPKAAARLRTRRQNRRRLAWRSQKF